MTRLKNLYNQHRKVANSFDRKLLKISSIIVSCKFCRCMQFCQVWLWVNRPLAVRCHGNRYSRQAERTDSWSNVLVRSSTSVCYCLPSCQLGTDWHGMRQEKTRPGKTPIMQSTGNGVWTHRLLAVRRSPPIVFSLNTIRASFLKGEIYLAAQAISLKHPHIPISISYIYDIHIRLSIVCHIRAPA